ncbi:ketoacyl-ACP synthase III [Desulfovibrio sp. OttesenSCG-928-G11]|nr:ketoacyl-ACP synthase III [Desulfovibrio sp. OttesenSCG-928-G11]
MTAYSTISGFGHAVPPAILDNSEIEARTDISNDWIVSRTGIKQRHILGPDQTGTDLALEATRLALARAGREARDISHIVYATCTPDACCPSAACTLGGKLGLTGIMALDINAACAGFVNGLEVADALALRRPEACVLLVAAECLSHRCNWEDRTTAVLFGDGAAAVLISGKDNAPQALTGSPSGKVRDVMLGSDGSKGDLLLISGGFSASPYRLGEAVGPEYFIRMQGSLVFKHAVRRMTECCRDLLERNGLESGDVDLFVPHQANLRIIEAVGERLEIPGERVFLNVEKYGNTSAASIPLALGEAVDQGRLRSGMRALLTSFGGGLTWGAALLEF